MGEIAWRHGTFRVRPPEDTWEAIQPTLRAAGCTRIADLTHLDPAGLPVHAAIRPAAASLATSHGKGLNADLSRVSAAMEAIETWYAERPLSRAWTATPASRLADRLDYPIEALPVAHPSLLTPDFPLDWTAATTLVSGRLSLVPAALLEIDRTVAEGTWRPPLFQVSTTGLASGNTVDEAVLHGLCELVEREAIAASSSNLSAFPVAPVGLDRAVQELITRVGARSGGFLQLYHLPNPVGIACFAAVARDGTLALPFGGFGCHPEVSIAASRAVTEAVQNRVALIAGSRDDLEFRFYRELQVRPPTPAPIADGEPCALPASESATTLEQHVRELAARIWRATGYEPLVVCLSDPDDAVAVVRVVAPGLRDHTMRNLRGTSRRP